MRTPTLHTLLTNVVVNTSLVAAARGEAADAARELSEEDGGEGGHGPDEGDEQVHRHRGGAGQEGRQEGQEEGRQ